MGVFDGWREMGCGGGLGGVGRGWEGRCVRICI